jgi:hypothetical protein
MAGDAPDKRLSRASRFAHAGAEPQGRLLLKVETEADLGKLRHAAGRLGHDDERLANMVVTLLRNGATVGASSAQAMISRGTLIASLPDCAFA